MTEHEAKNIIAKSSTLIENREYKKAAELAVQALELQSNIRKALGSIEKLIEKLEAEMLVMKGEKEDTNALITEKG